MHLSHLGSCFSLLQCGSIPLCKGCQVYQLHFAFSFRCVGSPHSCWLNSVFWICRILACFQKKNHSCFLSTHSPLPMLNWLFSLVCVLHFVVKITDVCLFSFFCSLHMSTYMYIWHIYDIYVIDIEYKYLSSPNRTLGNPSMHPWDCSHSLQLCNVHCVCHTLFVIWPISMSTHLGHFWYFTCFLTR